MPTPFPAQPERSGDSKDADARLSIVYEEIRDQVDGQLRQIQAADAKAGILVALSGALLAVVMVERPDLGEHGSILLQVESLLSGAVSIGYAFVTLWPREFRRDPNPIVLADSYDNVAFEDAHALLLQLVGNLKASFRQNSPILQTKVRRLRMAHIALAVQVTFGVIFAFARWFNF